MNEHPYEDVGLEEAEIDMQIIQLREALFRAQLTAWVLFGLCVILLIIVVR